MKISIVSDATIIFVLEVVAYIINTLRPQTPRHIADIFKCNFKENVTFW